MSGEAFTIWTVRLAALLYIAALGIWLTARSQRRWQIARVMWTAACLFYLAHVYGAFQFIRGWSHTAAYVETVRQTQELFGLAWGGGIYFNYLFTILWPGDVIWWWSNSKGYDRRPRWVTAVVHTFLAFMFFNGVVVFAAGPVRWVGIGATFMLFILSWKRRRRDSVGPSILGTW
jgi:hypothetical protein